MNVDRKLPLKGRPGTHRNASNFSRKPAISPLRLEIDTPADTPRPNWLRFVPADRHSSRPGSLTTMQPVIFYPRHRGRPPRNVKSVRGAVHARRPLPGSDGQDGWMFSIPHRIKDFVSPP